MKHLNKEATAVFRHLIAGFTLKPGEDHRRIDNTNGAFMAVVVETVEVAPTGAPIVSVAHYYEQNGDLMADPEMTFLLANDRVFPMSYRLDGLGVNRVAFEYLDKNRWRLNAREQAGETLFANQWMRNIKHQQFGGRLPKPQPTLG